MVLMDAVSFKESKLFPHSVSSIAAGLNAWQHT
jgi:hypothetical protein